MIQGDLTVIGSFLMTFWTSTVATLEMEDKMTLGGVDELNASSIELVDVLRDTQGIPQLSRT